MILEFPAEQPVQPSDEGGCRRSRDVQQIKKEIQEIFVCELYEKIKQSSEFIK